MKVTQSTQMVNRGLSKIRMSKEIMETLSFLGIPTEKFSDLKEEHGGLIKLHKWCEDQF